MGQPSRSGLEAPRWHMNAKTDEKPFCIKIVAGFVAFWMLLSLAACSSSKVYQIYLMPAPDIYDQADINPFADYDLIEAIPYEGNLYPKVMDFLNQTPDLRFINVTGADAATSRNGQAYFRKSPWVSSDILMTLLYDLSPGDRGLIKASDVPGWTFPQDYIQRLRIALTEASPAQLQ